MSVYSTKNLKGADGGTYDGSVADRFERDYEHMGKLETDGVTEDDRKDRQLDQQSAERQSRLYVDRVSGVSETGAVYPEPEEEPEAPAAWAPTTAYSLNDQVTVSGGTVLVAVTAGTSGEMEPVAPEVGASVTDGTVEWELA